METIWLMSNLTDMCIGHCTKVSRINFFSSTHETFSNTDLHHVTCQLYLSKAKGRNWSYVCPKSKSQPTFKNWKHTEYVLYAVRLEIRKEKIPWKCPLDPEINKMITSWS